MSGLSDQLVTISDRTILLHELDSLVKSFFSAKERPQLSELGIRDASIPFWSSVLAQGNQDAHSLEKMRQEILSYKTIHLTLPFEPSQVFLRKVITVFRAHVGDQWLLEVEFDEGLGAGVIYTMSGTIVDDSLEAKLKALDLHTILHSQVSVLSS